MGLKAKAGSQEFLKKHVLDEGLCTGCGACVNTLSISGYLSRSHGANYIKCDLEDGQCYSFCPRAATDLTALRKLLFEQDDMTPEIGAVKGYYFAQAVDPRITRGRRSMEQR